ncbi:O-antigen ligase family protein [Porticoccus sp. GXU_MW_L64]
MKGVFLSIQGWKSSFVSQWFEFKNVCKKAPSAHILPYISLFLYPTLVLQVKSGGSAMLGLLLFSGIYMLIKEKVKWDIKSIVPLYGCFVFFWLADFVTAGLAERAPLQGMLSSFTQIHFLCFPVIFVICLHLKNAWKFLMVGCLLALFFGIGDGIYKYLNRYMRIFGGVNSILYASVTLVYIALFIFYTIDRKRSWCWLIIAAAMIPVIFSFSRGVIFAVFPLIIVVLFYTRKSVFKWYRSKYFYMSLLILAFVGSMFHARMVDKVNLTIENYNQYLNGSNLDTSIGVRLVMYQGGWQLALENPLLGVGRENVNHELLKTSAAQRFPNSGTLASFSHLHNEYLTTFAGSGVVGLLSLALILIVPCVLIRKVSKNPIYRGQVTSLCMLYSVYGLSNLSFDNGTLNGLYILTLAVLFSAAVRFERSQQEWS